MPTQPSILTMMQRRMRSAVRQYNQAKARLDALEDEPTTKAELREAHNRERLLRGVVRGSAQMYLCVANPAEASNKDSINDLEVDYGFPGKRSRPKAMPSEVGAKFLREYYDED